MAVSIRTLTQDELAYVIPREMGKRYQHGWQWACMHCPVSSKAQPRWVCKDEAIAHAKWQYVHS